MDKSTHVVGIDPGIVHTGVVSVKFDPATREITPDHQAVLGLDAGAAKAAIEIMSSRDADIFIEGFRSRSHFGHDKEMIEGVRAFKDVTGGKVLDNTGIKKVVKPEVLKLLGIWDFTTSTHHQDLRSAARILVLGMLKDEKLNKLLADIVRDHLNNDTWKVLT